VPKTNTSSALISFRIPIGQYQQIENMRGDVPFGLLMKYAILFMLESGVLAEELRDVQKARKKDHD